jgi:hypothetical protein
MSHSWNPSGIESSPKEHNMKTTIHESVYVLLKILKGKRNNEKFKLSRTCP